MGGGQVSVCEDDQHHLLFTSLPIYTLTQTESISQSPDIFPTPLCEGTSPWRSLVGVGDMTHTHACCAGLTAAWRQEASTAETPPNWHLIITLVYRVGLSLLNYTHASAHTLSHIPSHANTHTHTHAQWIPLLKLASSQRNLGRAPRFNLANSSLFSLTIFNVKKPALIVCKQSPNYVYVFFQLHRTLL